jgi:transcriptional regulator with GAF, ATPase, and Fis domain
MMSDGQNRPTRELEQELRTRYDLGGIVTRDRRMLELLRLVVQVADSDAPVLLRGETGTGKEVFARALYRNSRRRTGPFSVLYCTALPASILESELFGHVRGAFTGARKSRAGRIAAASGGTLFLDEVGEIPLELQAKLLRFLQFGEIQRLGSDSVATVDVRVVAATHRDLQAMTRDGGFRENLYFRLKVVELEIPPLRERRGDIPLLLEHHAELAWTRPGPRPRFSPEALAALLAYDYPGNVRELEHIVQRTCVLARGPQIGLELLPPELRPCAGSRFRELTKAELRRAQQAASVEIERQFLVELLGRFDGQVTRAAQASGLHRTFLHKLIARHRDALGQARGASL